MLPLEALCENTSCLVQLIVSFRIQASLSGQPHHSYFWTIFTLPLPLLSVKSPSCVCKYNYIHKSILVGISRKTTTLRSGPKKKKEKRKQEGEGVGLINGAANAFLRRATVQQLKHMSSGESTCAWLYPIFIWLSAGTADPIAQLWTSANVDIQHVDI